jgi:hypothetical protein
VKLPDFTSGSDTIEWSADVTLNKFSISIWHCANHRLQLFVGNTVTQNARELKKFTAFLWKEILKIRVVLSTHWDVSIFRTASGMWKIFDALLST